MTVTSKRVRYGDKDFEGTVQESSDKIYRDSREVENDEDDECDIYDHDFRSELSPSSVESEPEVIELDSLDEEATFLEKSVIDGVKWKFNQNLVRDGTTLS